MASKKKVKVEISRGKYVEEQGFKKIGLKRIFMSFKYRGNIKIYDRKIARVGKEYVYEFHDRGGHYDLGFINYKRGPVKPSGFHIQRTNTNPYANQARQHDRIIYK